MQMKNVEHKWTVQDIPSQEGRLAVVTGATSGVGFYTAKAVGLKKLHSGPFFAKSEQLFLAPGVAACLVGRTQFLMIKIFTGYGCGRFVTDC
jgi:hypothetical protein